MEEMKQDESGAPETNQYHENLKRYHKASQHEYEPGSPEEQAFLDWERRMDEREAREKEIVNDMVAKGEVEHANEVEISGPVERIHEVIDIIDAIELEGIAAEDSAQQKLLAEKKAQARELILGLLQKDVVDYVSIVREFNRARVDTQKGELDPEAFREFDERRTIKHDSLISSINIVSRFITQNFGEMDEDTLDAYEEGLEERGQDILLAKRTALPKNIICPDYINMDVREEITDWALDISRSLAELHLE